MARISLERLVTRVKLVIDCESDAEAGDVYSLLLEQALDGGRFAFRIERFLKEEKTGD